MADIPSLRLNEQEIDSYQKTMRKAAANLKQLSDITGMEHRDLRARLFKKAFTPSEWPELSTDQVAVFIQALPAIMALRNLEWKLVQAFSRLAKKHACTWATKVCGSISDYDDFEQEAMLALLDAIYTYSQDDTKFVTYVWWVIRNRLANTANRCNPLGPLTNDAIKLLSRFDEVKCSLNKGVSDEEVFMAMRLTGEQVKTIREAKVKCYGQSVHTSVREQEPDPSNDYTEARRGIDSERDTVPCNYEVREAMDHAGLTPLERKIVDTSLFPHYGWQTELAQETINEQTGRPYTNARISQILQIALGKIKAAYLKRNVA